MDRSQRAEHHQQQQLNWQKSLSLSNGQAQAQFAGLQQPQTLPSSEMFTETMLPLPSDWHYMASGALLGANADEAALLRQMLSQTGLSDSMRCQELQSPSSNINAAAISIKEEDGCGLMCLPDPGFAERAARYSSFGGKFGHTDVGGGAFRRARDSCLVGFLGGNVNNGANVMARTASCPATVDGKDGICSSAVAPAAAGLMAVPEEASVVVSDKSSAGRACNDSGSRKRKSDRSNAQNQRGSSDSSESKDKRSKSTEKEDSKMKSDEACIKPASNNNEHSAESSPKKDVKPEPPKDYIHVRARRGQATDSHSLAERVRREKISERMRYLQDLVPGCNKVTGKAVMLDEIINYVKSLQRQVEFLSMKLAAVNPRLDFNIDHLIPKEMMAAPAACGNFSAAAASGPLATDIASFIQFQHIQQQQQAASMQPGPSCGSDMATVVTSAEASSLHGPDSSAEMFVDANFQGHPPSSWETADFRNMFNPPMMHSRQGQPQAHQFSCHSLAGHLELNQNKMEM